jgi:hypothetical protein
MNNLTFPNAVVIGAPKCGTSSLYFWLSAHPEICASPVKETFFFADDVNRFNRSANVLEHGISAYAAYFKNCAQAPVVLEATAPYLYYQQALKHIPALPSRPKCIVVLREPSARLYSQYRFERFRTKRINQSYAEYASDPVLLQHGDYAHWLRPWQEALGADRLHVVLFESLLRNPSGEMERMARFLNVDPSFYANYSFVQHNETVAIRSKRLHRLGLALQRYVPHSVQEALLPLYLKMNAGKMPAKDPDDDRVRAEVRAHYRTLQPGLEALFPDLDWSVWGS